ncbi:MAG: TetR/AcrR family transcriptional regulator [Myxococcales bacterium]|nr:TetR/AcrR family transcriptional regulator [Myxococcales bacterium]
MKVFAQYGFYNSKVSQVAKEAGVADGTIYLYFKNKEDILIQVFIDSMDEILRRQEEAQEGLEDPVEKLRVFAETHFLSVAESRALAEVITVELRQSSKFMRSTDMKPFGRYLGMIAKIIEEGQDAGAFTRTLSPRLTARAIFGAIDELALEWAMGKRQSSLSDTCAHTTELFLTGLQTRPTSTPSSGGKP